MKRKILLIDESLTVQKVVALTLDKQRYAVTYAKSRTEVIKSIIDQQPELILMSDSFHDVQWQSFPKEVEAWLGRNYDLPAIVLITGQDLEEARHYSGVLRKPFTPQQLQSMVAVHLPEGSQGEDEEDRPTEFIQRPGTRAAVPQSSEEEFEDQRLQKVFNDSFANEQDLTKETFGHFNKEGASMASPKNNPPRGEAMNNDLWGVGQNANPKVGNKPGATTQVMGAEDSMAYKATLESKVEHEIESKDLDAIVDRALSKLMPPIVERLVQERLDRLLKDQEAH